MINRLLLLLSGLLLVVNMGWAAQSQTTPIVSAPAYRQANTIAVLTIKGPIDEVTYKSLERRAAAARAAGVQGIVIELDTPGGELTAMLNICHLIKNDMPANTVAWVNHQAYSAGSVIALACREIVFAPSATMGDAAPIQIDPLGILNQLNPAERAKLEAPLRAEVVDSARRNHYDENLVQAFISVEIQLWLIENTQTHETAFVDADEFRDAMGEDPPHTAARSTTGNTAAVNSPQAQINRQFDAQSPADLVAASETSLEEMFLKSRPPVRERLTAADRGNWRLVMQVDRDDQLLVVRTAEAKFYGLAKGVVANEQELKSFFGAVNVIRLDESWSEGLVRVMTSLPVRALLIIIFLVCLFIEIATPGVGFFGITALVALVLLIGTPALIGLAQWWTLVMILVGLSLVLLELFVIPGFGITGVAGAVCVLAGLVGVFVSGDISTIEGRRDLWTGIGTTLVSLFASGIGIWFIARQLETIPLFQRLVLTAEIKPSSETSLLDPALATQRVLEIGDQGSAVTDLRPVGKAIFGDRLVEVQSTAGYIDRGTPIVVVRIAENQIDVEELRA